MEKFNSLTSEQKRGLFIGVYNLMVRYHRFCGWVVYYGDHFEFFDSKPSSDDTFWVTTDELVEWIEDLKSKP